MSVVKQLLVRAGADFSGMRKEFKKAQDTVKNFKVNMNKQIEGVGTGLAKVAAVAAASVAVVTAGMAAAAKSAMDFEANVMRVNRMLGDSSATFYSWARDNAAAMGMSKAEAAKYAATYGNLIRIFEKDTGRLTKQTQDLVKVMAVVSSATGRTMDDVGERIRSGMLGNTEAIEDLGILAQTSVIQMSDAFKQLSNGRTWDQIASQNGILAQQIRYLSIVEQAAKQYGVELTKNTHTATSKFTAQLKNLQTALGMAFLPILNAVLPALTAMARSLATVATYVAQFMSSLFGGDAKKATTQQTKATDAQVGSVSSLGDSYKAAGKAAKGALASFDEVNQLDTSGGESGAGAGEVSAPSLGGGQLFDPYSISPMEAFAGKLADITGKAKEMRDALKGIIDQANGLGESIKGFVQTPAVQTFLDFLAGRFWKARKGDMEIAEGSLEGWKGFFQILEGIVTLDVKKTIDGIKTSVDGAVKSIGAILDQLGLTGNGYFTVNSWWQRTVNDWEWIRDNAKSIWAGVTKGVKEGWKALEEYPWSAVTDAIGKKWDQFKTDAGTKWEAIKSAVATKWEDMKAESNLKADALKILIGGKWEEIKNNIAPKWDAIKTAISDKWEEIKGISWSDVKDRLSTKWDEVKTDVSTKWTSIRETLNTKWGEFLTMIGWDKIKTTLSTKWDEIKTDVGTKWEDIKTALKTKWDEIVKLDFSGVKKGVVGIWNELEVETGRIWGNIGTTIKNAINAVIRNINSFIGKVNDISIDIPSVKNPLNGKTLVEGFSIGIPNIPRIPELARGGIVDGATNFGNYIAGERGSELVMPLEQTTFVDKIAGALGTAVMNAMQMGQGGNSSGGGDIVLQISGTEIARAIKPYLDSEQGRVGNMMIRTT
ncbi:phage tail protein [Paenibacillus sp. strain BS8-2]